MTISRLQIDFTEDNQLKKANHGWTAVIKVIECPPQFNLCRAKVKVREVLFEKDVL